MFHSGDNMRDIMSIEEFLLTCAEHHPGRGQIRIESRDRLGSHEEPRSVKSQVQGPGAYSLW